MATGNYRFEPDYYRKNEGIPASQNVTPKYLKWFCSEGSSHDIHGKTTNLNNYVSKGYQYVQEKAFKKMNAAIFEKPGLENLKIKHDVEQSKITDHDVSIRVKMAGVNPIDHMKISGKLSRDFISSFYCIFLLLQKSLFLQRLFLPNPLPSRIFLLPSLYDAQ